MKEWIEYIMANSRLGFDVWDVLAAIVLLIVIVVFAVHHHRLKKREKELADELASRLAEETADNMEADLL